MNPNKWNQGEATQQRTTVSLPKGPRQATPGHKKQQCLGMDIIFHQLHWAFLLARDQTEEAKWAAVGVQEVPDVPLCWHKKTQNRQNVLANNSLGRQEV